MLAIRRLLQRFLYSLVWCNKVNCLAVQDEVLGGKVHLPLDTLDRGRLNQHPCDRKHRPMAVIGDHSMPSLPPS